MTNVLGVTILINMGGAHIGKIAAVVSSVLLAGSYVCYQAGCIQLPFGKSRPAAQSAAGQQGEPRVLLAGSKSLMIGPTVAQASTKPIPQPASPWMLMSGSKSGAIGPSVGVGVATPTLLPSEMYPDNKTHQMTFAPSVKQATKDSTPAELHRLFVPEPPPLNLQKTLMPTSKSGTILTPQQTADLLTTDSMPAATQLSLISAPTTQPKSVPTSQPAGLNK